ncbi:MAG: hypothetical protein K0S54_3279 [Alphaproteobacteria bacterium]|nr:hypothetical protein [Alphaproteobacteria bacterium]
MNKFLLAAVLALLSVLCLPALAQEAPPAASGGNVIDFTPIINELSLALASVLGAGLLYLLKLVRDWFKARTGVELQISDEQVRQVLDKAIQYGIALVVGRLGNRAQLAVSNAQVAQIANYVIAAVPGALANFGITPERLQDMIRARLIAWTEGKASPQAATPAAVPAPTEAVAS